MLIKLVFALMLAAHLIGCLFWGLFTLSDGTPMSPDSWIATAGLHNANEPWEQYIPTVYVARFSACIFILQRADAFLAHYPLCTLRSAGTLH